MRCHTTVRRQLKSKVIMLEALYGKCASQCIPLVAPQLINIIQVERQTVKFGHSRRPPLLQASCYQITAVLFYMMYKLLKGTEYYERWRRSIQALQLK